MSFTGKSGTKCFWSGLPFCLVMVLSAILLLSFGKAGLAVENESVQHYKMLSTVEYSGNGQFKNHVETLMTVRKEFLLDDKVRYFLSTDDFDLVESDLTFNQQSCSRELSFVIDRKTRRLSGSGRKLAIWGKIDNECVKSLEKVTKENIGKTWKQSFKLSNLGKSLPEELKFAVTAIQLKTKVFGEMIAVRALSEPFVVKVVGKKGGEEPIQSGINAVYLFSPDFEDIYMSISVFEATTRINGFKEKLWHEVVTYRTDGAGVAVDFSGLDKNFERFVRKLGLPRRSVKVVKKSPLPQWALSEGLRAAQLTNMYAAMACEGALNPVATVCIPVARVVAMQSFGRLVSASELGSVSVVLSKNVPDIGAMKIAVASAFVGVGLGTAGAIAGGTAGAVTIAGGSSPSKHSHLPVNSCRF